MIEEISMPKASIVIPAYNASAYITKTLDSILSQSMEDFECLVIDDGSTDNTADLVAAYKDQRIRFLRHANSGRPAIPRNQGLINARGKYIFIFDSDDIMLPDKLQMTVAALDAHPDVDMVFTNFQSIDDKGELLNPNYLEEYDTLLRLLPDRNSEVNLLDPSTLFNAIIHTNFIGTSSVALRRSALGQEHRFDHRLKNSEDRLFWTRFLKKHKAIFINKVLHQYRILDTGISRQSFIKRGPAKIQGLKYIRELCDTAYQKKCVSQQIASDYAVLSAEYRRQGDYLKAIKAAMQSIKWGINVQALKAFTAAIVAPLIKRKQ